MPKRSRGKIVDLDTKRRDLQLKSDNLQAENEPSFKRDRCCSDREKGWLNAARKRQAP
ncbi:MAG: hypothetical protein R2727_02395 [Bacteroidales bacterium]